jgi:sulfhydrogenase subunit beta (sulfur reductase)
MDVSAVRILPKQHLDALIAALRARDYRVLGPTLRDGGVLFEEVERAADLPIGLRDDQDAGRYRLSPGVAGEVFGVVNGAGSLKPLFFAPEEPLLALRHSGRAFSVEPLEPPAVKLAVLGVRACDLAALAMQDRIFLHDRFRDTHYAARRADTMLIAVNCTRAAATCFCASMATGPKASRGFDVALTELEDGFIVETGSAAGAALLESVAPLLQDADPQRCAEAQDRIDECGRSQRRRLDTRDLPRLLYENLDHPRWNDVAQRCLSCTNCTMVCPTCFCHAVVDVTELNGNMTQRLRRWDSCFLAAHAQIRGKNFRPTVHDRYRQWLTHKLASWIDQFGSSGCTGCGRCIAWCPVGIDLTEEVAAIRGSAEVAS